MENNVRDEALVSVVIPCYNQAQYLPEAIQSVLAQTYPDIEIIIVNDGSHDNITEVISPFLEESRITVYNQANGGSATARNSGIKLARGNYFLFLDADDWLDPAAIEKLIEPLAACKPVGLAYCDHYHFYEKTGRLLEKSSNSFGSVEQDPLKVLWARSVFPVHAALLKREWLERVGPFDSGLPWMEEFDFWLRLGLEGCPMRHVALPLVYYRQHSASKTRRITPEIVSELYTRIRHQNALKYPEQVRQAATRTIQNLGCIIDQERWDNNQLRLEIEATREQLELTRKAFKEAENYALHLEKELVLLKQNHKEAEKYAMSLKEELALVKENHKEAETYALSLAAELARKPR